MKFKIQDFSEEEPQEETYIYFSLEVPARLNDRVRLYASNIKGEKGHHILTIGGLGKLQLVGEASLVDGLSYVPDNGRITLLDP